ncbi:MAG TPA: HAD family hydrolase [Opitutaceae bacterium]|nr:HAD family hydrolase [Opitutaceae bacterium]
MSAAPDTYLLDLDGTLIDHFAVIHRTYAQTLAKFGRPPPTPEEVRAAVGGGLEHAMRRFFPPEQIPEAAKVYRAFWSEGLLDGVKLMPGARELLRALRGRGAKLGVLTNKLGSSSRAICDYLKIAPLLDAVVGAQDTAWLKPRPELTAHVLAQLGSSAGRAVMVGDSPYDVETAHQGGFPAWCVSTGTHDAAQLRAARADRIFADLDELRRFAAP